MFELVYFSALGKGGGDFSEVEIPVIKISYYRNHCVVALSARGICNNNKRAKISKRPYFTTNLISDSDSNGGDFVLVT